MNEEMTTDKGTEGALVADEASVQGVAKEAPCGSVSGAGSMDASACAAAVKRGAQASPAASTSAAFEPAKGGKRVRHWLWAGAGFVFFGLGCVGVALPFIPTTPFILLAAFCFARSSKRVNDWFKSTKLYHQVLEGYVTKRRMTVKAKLTILIPVTILLAIGFALMSSVPAARVVLVVVWVAHIIYFGFVVKADKEDASVEDAGAAKGAEPASAVEE